MSKPIISIAILCAALAMPQTAVAGLADEAEINGRILVVAVADKIRRSCGSISGRLFKARGYVSDTKDMALERGYSEAQIETYINDKIEKYHMRKRRDKYFTQNGADRDNKASLCVLGRKEITQKTDVGQLLRTN